MRDLPVRLIALCVGLAVLAFVLYASLRTTPAAISEDTPSETAPDLRRDPRAATQHVERETCNAACEAEDRACRAMALEEESRIAACARERESCATRCPLSPREGAVRRAQPALSRRAPKSAWASKNRLNSRPCGSARPLLRAAA